MMVEIRYKYRSFEDAKEFVHNRIITNYYEWVKYCRSGEKPEDIPAHPERAYKNSGWRGWRDWLMEPSVKQKLTLTIDKNR